MNHFIVGEGRILLCHTVIDCMATVGLLHAKEGQSLPNGTPAPEEADRFSKEGTFISFSNLEGVEHFLKHLEQAALELHNLAAQQMAELYDQTET